MTSTPKKQLEAKKKRKINNVKVKDQAIVSMLDNKKSVDEICTVLKVEPKRVCQLGGIALPKNEDVKTVKKEEKKSWLSKFLEFLFPQKRN